jgi:site-specific recombinase XerD
MTITRWCESGKLPAIPKPYGRKLSYLVHTGAISALLMQQSEAASEPRKPNKPKDTPVSHESLVPKWLKAMESGLMGGRPFSKRTIGNYRFYLEKFLHKHHQVSMETLTKELSSIPPHQFAKRLKICEATTSFAKFLIRQNCLDASFLEAIKPLIPKRHVPPKRHSVTAEQIQALLAHCHTSEERLIIQLLSETGLRSSELCALKLSDLDLERCALRVRCGKGGKERAVGLSRAAVAVLEAFLAEHKRKPEQHLLRKANGQPLHRDGVFQRVQSIGRRAGVTVSSHALRRAFVTINAGKGRPLVYLQRACGHTDIRTTMGYCRTSEEEVINAMKDWD